MTGWSTHELERYVRSGYGAGSAWYGRARTHGEGRIRAGGVEREAAFGTVVGPDAADVTLRLEAR